MNTDEASATLAAMAQPMRFAMLMALSRASEPMESGALAGAAGATPSNASTHLGILERAGLVSASRRGRVALYSLIPDRFVDTARFLEDLGRLGMQKSDRST